MSAEGPQLRQTLERSEKTNFQEIIPVDEKGWPLVQISVAAAELVPTRQYGNCSVGPIAIKRYIREEGDEKLLEEIHKTQSLCEKAVSEDRETVHNMLRQSEQGRLV